MRFLTAATAITALCTTVLARYNGAPQAKSINNQAYNLKAGKYRFVNVKTKQGLTYVRANQQFYAAPGKGDLMTVTRHEKHVIISPSSSNNKCLSAQWNYDQGADGSAALYACRVKRSEVTEEDVILADEGTPMLEMRSIDENALSKKDTIEKRAALTLAKQYFWVHPGCGRNAVHIVTSDHITDQKPRVVAASSSLAVYNRHSRLANIVQLNERDQSQCWYIYNQNGKMVRF